MEKTLKKDSEEIKKEIDILLVDDNAKTRQTFSSRLRLLGVNIEAAISGFHAISLMESNIYSLVIIMGNMSDMPAFEMISLIKDNHKDVLVIFKSMNSKNDIEKEDAEKYGINVYLKRDDNFNIIFPHIKKMLPKLNLI